MVIENLLKSLDGYQIIRNGEDFILKKMENKQEPPRSWKEFCEKYPTKEGEAYINASGEVISARINHSSREDKNWCASMEEAGAFLALMQLRQLRKAWVVDWNPTSETKLFAWIETSHNHYKTYVNYGTQECGRVLSFPTKEMAEDFLNCFRDLCEKAKILL